VSLSVPRFLSFLPLFSTFPYVSVVFSFFHVVVFPLFIFLVLTPLHTCTRYGSDIKGNGAFSIRNIYFSMPYLHKHYF
jgi:hypothetical protein